MHPNKGVGVLTAEDAVMQQERLTGCRIAKHTRVGQSSPINPLRGETSLSLDQFRRACGAILLVISHVIDASAYWIASPIRHTTCRPGTD